MSHGKYVGPSMHDCLSPGTWATDLKPPPSGKGKAHVVLRDSFVDEWVVTIRPARFVHRRNPQWSYSEDEFNAKVAPFSDSANVARLLRARLPAQAETVVYEPNQASGLITLDGRSVVNMYQPSPVRPVSGDPGPFLQLMERLIPIKRDREFALNWIATLIARPDIKMSYGLLLVSEAQGVGKTTLAEKVLAPLVGMHNCSFPQASEVTEGRFNSWQVGVRLAVVGEIYSGHSKGAYNRLKQVITDTRVRVEEKYEKPFDQTNWTHIAASSNSKRALKIAFDDRRWLIPRVTEEAAPPEFWRGFNEWLETGGLEIIAYWASERVKQPESLVRPGMEAPITEAKRESVYEAMSDGERAIFDLGRNLQCHEKRGLMRLDLARDWLLGEKDRDGFDRRHALQTLESAETITRLLKAAGLRRGPKQYKHLGDRFRVVANFEIPADATWADLQQFELSPSKVDELDGPNNPFEPRTDP